MNLTRVLAFGQPEQQNKGLTNVPTGVSPIDREFIESKRTYIQEKDNSRQKQRRDLETVLREFS